jgi:hypothetical protein
MCRGILARIIEQHPFNPSHPFNRPLAGDQVSAAVLFLCGEAGRDIIGEAFHVSGSR